MGASQVGSQPTPPALTAGLFDLLPSGRALLRPAGQRRPRYSASSNVIATSALAERRTVPLSMSAISPVEM